MDATKNADGPYRLHRIAFEHCIDNFEIRHRDGRVTTITVGGSTFEELGQVATGDVIAEALAELVQVLNSY